MSSEISRRSFIKKLACGTAVTLSFSASHIDLLSALENSTDDEPGPSWAPIPGKAKHRIDGLAKVLGKKLYARDFRARDMDGWPERESYIYAIRAGRINRVIESYDLSVLPDELMPTTVIDAARIEKDNMSLAGGMIKPFFVTLGDEAEYYGQPVTMLVFENFQTFTKAKSILQFNEDIIQYGDFFSEKEPELYDPTSTYVRDDDRQFNYVANSDDYFDQYTEVSQNIESTIASSEWHLFERDFNSQTMDPVFMEPEAGLAWFNHDSGTLQLVLGTQSPAGDIWKIADIFGNENCRFSLNNIELKACYPGGGFGGRDDSYFPKYLALCSAYVDGPVRWVYDRYEQFQVGIKRHETNFSEQIAIDDNGIIRALKSKFTMNGGGRQNLSPYVAQLAAMSSSNCYDIKKAMAYGEARDTKDLVGGSQRGFGGPQAFMAIETLLDEAANNLNIDPFELRRKNLLDKDSKTITGAPVLQDLQLNAILEKLEKQPIWKNRHAQQKEFSKSGLKYGVGLALSNQAYGNEADGMYAGIELLPDGTIKVHTPYIDMGNGAATALGLAPATYLGRNADHINMGEIALFDQLDLTTYYEEYSNIFVHALTKFGLMDDTTNDRYVTVGSSASTACLSAFHQHHVVEQAGKVLLHQTILPAASEFLGIDIEEQEATWLNGTLKIPGQRDLKWRDIVKFIFENELPTIAAVHGSFMAEFVRADFEFSNTEINLPLDYVAAGRSQTDLTPLTRSNITYPPSENYRYGRSTYAPCGALVSVTINPDTGHVQLQECVSVLSAGKQLCPEIIKGQSEGGIAMSIGYVLHENCPNTEDGPGGGNWNLGQYKIASNSDMPNSQELIILDPPEGETTARGIAEAVMCPIPAAIMNALSMATDGHRFSKLPVTDEDIKGVLS